MAKCWETRGCDDEMQAECPHPNELQDRCPTKCVFANLCQRPTHAVCTDPELLFDTSLNRDGVAKETCLFCEFFLKNGPRVA